MNTILATGTAASVAVSAEQLQPILDSLNANLDVLLPIGISIMGVMIGIGLIPRIIYKFL